MKYPKALVRSASRLLFAGSLLAVSASLLAPSPVLGQGGDWRAVLEGEKAKNAQRLAAIDKEGAPIAQQLRQVNQKVASHNAKHPSGTCEYPPGHPEVCTPWLNEAQVLNKQQQSLRSKLIPLVEEQERLRNRNAEIERRLHCVQTPVSCKSDNDCECSHNCGAFWDGARSDTGLCQPGSR
jgi:hypothetical protein